MALHPSLGTSCCQPGCRERGVLSLANNISRSKNELPAWAGRGGDSLGWLQGGKEGLGEQRSGKSSGEMDIALAASVMYLFSLSQALTLAFSNPQLNE